MPESEHEPEPEPAPADIEGVARSFEDSAFYKHYSDTVAPTMQHELMGAMCAAGVARENMPTGNLNCSNCL